jgi:hypothetical protein
MLTHLPEEVLVHILSLLDTDAARASAARTCKRIRGLQDLWWTAVDAAIHTREAADALTAWIQGASPRMQTLRLLWAAPAGLSPKIFAGVTNLASLDLRQDAGRWVCVYGGLPTLPPTLRRLRIHTATVTTFDALRDLACLTHLELLSVTDHWQGSRVAEDDRRRCFAIETALQSLTSLRHLKVLRLGDIELPDVGCVGNLTALRHLRLPGAGSYCSGSKALGALTRLTALECVSVQSWVSCLTGLQRLRLSGTVLTPELSGLAKLTYLHVPCAPVAFMRACRAGLFFTRIYVPADSSGSPCTGRRLKLMRLDDIVALPPGWKIDRTHGDEVLVSGPQWVEMSPPWAALGFPVE